ncbi:MAG: hypothetical protein AAF903_07255 [Pseudomonadota bacterium]
MFHKFHSLSQSAAMVTLFIGLGAAVLPTAVYADEHGGSFSFSAALQESLDNFAAARAELRGDIRATLQGLTREEAREQRGTFREEIQALRAQGRALRAQTHAELEAAGISPPDRAARGGRNGRGGAAGEGPGRGAPGAGAGRGGRGGPGGPGQGRGGRT